MGGFGVLAMGGGRFVGDAKSHVRRQVHQEDSFGMTLGHLMLYTDLP